MKQNVGILDTAIRSIVACVILALAIENIFDPVTNTVMIVLGVMLWISSTFGVCLLYKMLGIDTYPDFRDDSYHAH